MLINILDRVPKPVIAPTIISCFFQADLSR